MLWINLTQNWKKKIMKFLFFIWPLKFLILSILWFFAVLGQNQLLLMQPGPPRPIHHLNLARQSYFKMLCIPKLWAVLQTGTFIRRQWNERKWKNWLQWFIENQKMSCFSIFFFFYNSSTKNVLNNLGSNTTYWRQGETALSVAEQ